MRYVLFTDNLADLTIPEACEAAKRAGFDGLDLTRRPSGHVKPEDADRGLADAKRAADAAGLTIPMVSTALTDEDSPHAEAIFAAAAHYGARHLKLGYWEYRPFGTLAAQSTRPAPGSNAWFGSGGSTTSCLASTATPADSWPPAGRCCT